MASKRTGLIIGKALADKFGWQVGDNVPLSTSIWMNKEGSFTWHFTTVSAIYQSSDNVDDDRVFFHHAYFDQARAYSRNSVSWLIPKYSRVPMLNILAKILMHYLQMLMKRPEPLLSRCLLKSKPSSLMIWPW